MSRILVATCDPALAAHLHHALRGAGHRTEGAVDGETALFLARASGFDRIILGEDLPLMNGPEVLAQIRSEGVNTPAIVLGGTNDGGTNDGGRGTSREDARVRHLAAPFRVTELLDAVCQP